MILLLAMPAFATQEFHQPIDLEQLTRMSTAVAVVEEAQPSTRELVVPIERPGGPYPDYGTTLARVTVVEVLQAPSGLLTPGQVVELGAANAEETLDLHIEYYVNQMGISPIFPEYEGSLRGLPVPGKHIAFLRPCTIGPLETLCYSAIGAVESVEKVAEIRALLGGSAPAGEEP